MLALRRRVTENPKVFVREVQYVVQTAKRVGGKGPPYSRPFRNFNVQACRAAPRPRVPITTDAPAIGESTRRIPVDGEKIAASSFLLD